MECGNKLSVWIELSKKEIKPLFWRGTNTNSPIGDWTGDDVPILDKVTDIVTDNIKMFNIPNSYVFEVELTSEDIRYLKTRRKDEWAGKFKPILDKLTEAVMNEYEGSNVNSNEEYKMTEDICIYDTKNAIEKLVPWICEQINKSSDRYIRMRLSDLKKEMGKTFEDMYDAEFYWGLKPILFDLGIVTGSTILKDGTDAITMRMKTKKDISHIPGNIWIYDTKKADERLEYFSKTPKLSDKDLKKHKDEYLKSLDEEEREKCLGRQKFWEEHREKRRKEREETVKKYDGGTIVAIRHIDVDDRFSDTTEDTNIFTAVLKNGKIGIFVDNGFDEDYLFCDFLRNEYELEIFFDEAPSAHVGFVTNEIINGIERDIYFSHGLWSPSEDDMSIVGDKIFNNRDELIQTFASLAINPELKQ